MPATALSPEARLVFRSADPALSRSECATLVGEARDWPRVFTLAEREVASLGLWRAVQASGVAPPIEIADALRVSALQTDLRMQQLARRLRQTTRALGERGIPCLLIKGAAVGALSDPTFRARPMTDVDLLVHRDDRERAQEAVLEAGWSVTTNPVYLALLRDAHHLPPFVDAAQPGVRLELHVTLMPDDHPFAFDEGLLWRDARPAPAPFEGAAVPSPAHLLLHACVHFAWQHTLTFGAWRTFRVVEMMGGRSDFDWNRFVATAREVKAGTSCYWTLRLARTLGGLHVPDHVLDALAPPTPEFLRRAIERHLISGIAPGEGPTSPSERLTRGLWRAALRPRWSGHANPGRADPENRWAKAYGTASTESRGQRLKRHLVNFRDWTRFLGGTLLR